MRGDFQLSSANVPLNEPLNVPFNANLNEEGYCGHLTVESWGLEPMCFISWPKNYIHDVILLMIMILNFLNLVSKKNV